jgi:hypothetical protein
VYVVLMFSDNLNPTFAKKFIVEYFFEESQELKFEIYDSDSSSPDLSRHDYVGYFITSLGSIVSAPGQNVTEKIKTKAVYLTFHLFIIIIVEKY